MGLIKFLKEKFSRKKEVKIEETANVESSKNIENAENIEKNCSSAEILKKTEAEQVSCKKEEKNSKIAAEPRYF